MMMELQAHQGTMPGIQLYGSRCNNPYTSTIPRPLFLDGLHSRHNNTLARDNFQAWASNNKVLSEDVKLTRTSSLAKPDSFSTEASTLSLIPSLAKPKPFMATAGFPDDIPRFVEIEFAAFQHEYINHHLSYRDPSNPEHTARTIAFYEHCMQNIRTSTPPSPSKRHDSKVDLTLTADDDTEHATTTEGYRFRKVIDPITHDIIAFVKSEITTLTPELHATPLDFGHESEPEMNRAWFALNEKVHRDYCGSRQHVCKCLPKSSRQHSDPTHFTSHPSIHPSNQPNSPNQNPRTKN
jgi:hypothetical protein